MRRRKKEDAFALRTSGGLKCARLADGTLLPRPPMNNFDTSIPDLGEIRLVGPNFKTPTADRLANYKRGLRLSTVYDNVSSYGSREWTTCNSEFGQVCQPSLLKAKRAGLISFELLRFLPNHPHWKDRPYKPGQHIPCAKSTYSDLGSYFLPGYRLPPEYQFTTQRPRRTMSTRPLRSLTPL